MYDETSFVGMLLFSGFNGVLLFLLGLVTMTFKRTVSGGRGSASETVTVTGESAAYANPTIPKAWTGDLTTRASGTAGTITMTSGSHTITTASRIDIFWDTGAAYGATVGTVAGASVPFTLASGDALPTLVGGHYDVIACNPVEAAFSVVGDDVQALYASCTNRGYIVFEESGSVAYAKELTSTDPVIWATGDAGANPLAGKLPISVFMSNVNTTSTSSDMKAEASVN